MQVPERWQKVMQIVAKNGAATVEELVTTLGISAATVRRTLESMHQAGLVRRIHGGAVANHVQSDQVSLEAPAPTQTNSDWLPLPSVDMRPQRPVTAELRRIAANAGSLIENEDTILLDGGSTAYALAEALCDTSKRITVITPSIRVAFRLYHVPGITVVLTGGQLYPHDMGLRGVVAEETLSRFRASKLFLGVLGLSAQTGLAYSSLELAQLKRAMVGAADQVIVICSQQKFQAAAGASIIPIDKVDVLITGIGAPEAEISHLRQRGVDVRLV